MKLLILFMLTIVKSDLWSNHAQSLTHFLSFFLALWILQPNALSIELIMLASYLAVAFSMSTITEFFTPIF